jgi:hypothetical protein
MKPTLCPPLFVKPMRSQNGRLISLTLPLKTAEDFFKPSAGPMGARQVQADTGLAEMLRVPKAAIHITTDIFIVKII